MRRTNGVLILAIVFCLVGAARGDILTFGPVASSSMIQTTAIPSGYGGFTWDSHFRVVGDNLYKAYFENSYGAPSGGAASNWPGTLDLSVSGSLFNFVGAAFTGFAYNDNHFFDSTTITVFGYDASNNLVGSASMELSITGYSFLNANLNGVTLLVFESSGPGKAWLMDNFTYNTVPEPGSLVLLGSGLIGLAGAIRRKLIG